MRARRLPFRQFYLELASDLKIEAVPPTMHESAAMMMREDTVLLQLLLFTYNKHEAYFSKPHLIECRMN